MGYKTISLELAQELKDHGVNPDFVAEMKKLGGKDVSLEEAIELRGSRRYFGVRPGIQGAWVYGCQS